MSRVLVVEDSSTQAVEVQLMLEEAGHQVALAADGAAALEVMARGAPDLVVTDLQMPRLDGLQLVDAIRAEHPAVPVVLMTAHGSEEMAAEALQRGAASYVPKRRLARDLVRTVGSVLAVAGAGRPHPRALACWQGSESRYLLENDPALIPLLVGHLADNLVRLGLDDGIGLIRINVALGEALSNAIYHGNLEVSSALREGSEAPFDALVARRRAESPYRERRVHVVETVTPAGVSYTVRDEGPGFDPDALPDALDPENLEKASGRGVLLIRTFMDQVTFSRRGNEITMSKRRGA